MVGICSSRARFKKVVECQFAFGYSSYSPSCITQAFKVIEKELWESQENIASKERWLVFNKIDTINKKDHQKILDQVTNTLQWEGPVFFISAVTKEGTEQLKNSIMEYIEKHD